MSHQLKLVWLSVLGAAVIVTTAAAHNKVVVIPMGADAPEINMQCQDGGLEYADCGTCQNDEVFTGGCCADESSACANNSSCVALSLCLLGCPTQQCVDNCRASYNADVLELYDAVQICLGGTGEPNVDGACGLICAPPPEPPAPAEDIFIELTWDTPGDPNQFDTGPGAGSDLDLHFAHAFADEPDLDGDGSPDPWFDSPFDVYAFNSNPNWANPSPGVDDNPLLLVDDTDGAGPEIITLNNPENIDYEVGVYATADNGFGDSLATVTVWSEGQIVYTASAILRERSMWWVGSLTGGTTTFSPHIGASSQFRITPNYEHPSFPPPP